MKTFCDVEEHVVPIVIDLVTIPTGAVMKVLTSEKP